MKKIEFFKHLKCPECDSEDTVTTMKLEKIPHTFNFDVCGKSATKIHLKCKNCRYHTELVREPTNEELRNDKNRI